MGLPAIAGTGLNDPGSPFQSDVPKRPYTSHELPLPYWGIIKAPGK